MKDFTPYILLFSSVQSLSRVWLFATPWIAARQASLSITISWSLVLYVWWNLSKDHFPPYSRMISFGKVNVIMIAVGISHMLGMKFSHSAVSNSATPWTAAHQASLSITNSWSWLRLISIESVMPSNHLILCHPLLLSPSIFPSIRVFSNESNLEFCLEVGRTI